jgi:hypothetical protein
VILRAKVSTEEDTRRAYMTAAMTNAAMVGKLGKLAEWLPGAEETSGEHVPAEAAPTEL